MFKFPPPAPRFEGDKAEISVVLRQSAGFGMSNARTASVAAFAKEHDRWLRIGTNHKESSHTSQIDADWFIEKMQRFLPVFEPDFACGDTDVMIGNRLGDDPTSLVWPLVYYGPTHVERIGREKLLKAPAWEVTQDPRGGVWLQATENPFTARPKDLDALADHLGLEKRR
jgi:hypothetical protein